MTVAAILSEKGTDVLTVEPGTSLADIIEILSEKKIGATVVVNPDSSVCGIISERDVVRELASHGSKALKNPVSDCMTASVISCSPHDTVNEVMEVMTANRFRHMPVIVDGKLGGIISIGDVVKRKIEQAERDAEEMRNYISAS